VALFDLGGVLAASAARLDREAAATQSDPGLGGRGAQHWVRVVTGSGGTPTVPAQLGLELLSEGRLEAGGLCGGVLVAGSDLEHEGGGQPA
jgi:hypothetical protein